MTSLAKPVPALYTVYVLRSTVRHASLYIGSTPNPPRRLKQHNGEAKGGAVRTSRSSLRPWEMIMILSGFPSSIAALQFEWALTNPHLTQHIPKEERLSFATHRKKNGMPKRPLPSLSSIISNIHLLVGVPGFARWPLNWHFFSKEAYSQWKNWENSKKLSRDNLNILTDFGPVGGSSDLPCGIDALPLDHSPMKRYVEKAHNVVSFEREGNCVHCHEEMKPNEGLYGMCANGDCEAMGHLDCWSKHSLASDDHNALIPQKCQCPSCGGQIRWVDMVKELSLRTRGADAVAKLLQQRKRKGKATATAPAFIDSP